MTAPACCRILIVCALAVLAGSPAGPAAARQDSAPPNVQTVTLLIVVPDAWRTVAQHYLDARGDRLEGRLATLGEIERSASGSDPAEKIKRFLFDEFRKQPAGGPLSVLLVGDADRMPVRYMMLDRNTEAAWNVAFYPSDLYYADLADSDGNFEDWNASREGHHAGYFGEVHGEHFKDGPINRDAVDYLPEIAVGRWPCSSPEELQAIVDKSLEYARRVESGSPDGASTAAFFAVQGWVDCRGEMAAMADRLGPAWTVHRHLFADGDAPPEARAAVDASHVVDRLNSGLSLLVHAGHGHPHGWEHSLASPDLRRLNNRGGMPMVVSAGCSTAAFATLPPYEPYRDVAGVQHIGTNHGEVFREPPPPPDCLQPESLDVSSLAEQLLFLPGQGAIGYFGCNTGSQPCALTLVDGFVAGMADPDCRTLGQCWQRSIRHYHLAQRLADLQPDDGWYPPSIFFQGMKFMLFTDPSLPISRSRQAPAGPGVRPGGN